eukprot:3367249-Amphidinium_carterae.1
MLKKEHIDFMFYYTVNGVNIGSIARHQFWFEKRTVDKSPIDDTKVEKYVMVTSRTVRRRGDPFNDVDNQP